MLSVASCVKYTKKHRITVEFGKKCIENDINICGKYIIELVKNSVYNV